MTKMTDHAHGLRLLAALLLAAFVSLAAAHAHLDVATPDDHNVVTEPLAELSLTFTEPVETDFSRFELYRLDIETSPDGYASPGGSAWAKLDEAAKAWHDELVARGPQDAGAEGEVEGAGHTAVPLELLVDGATDEVTLEIDSELPAGDYMLFYNILSVDTHTSSGYLLFSYQPEH